MRSAALSISVTALIDSNPIVGPKREGGKRFWNTRELKLLRENYPVGGLAACVEALPGRTAASIYNKARASGVVGKRRPGPGVERMSWPNCDRIDDVIRRRYPTCAGRGDVVLLSQSVARPRWWVSKRAVALGLVAPRFKSPDWTPIEDEIVAARQTQALATIRRALQRSGFERTETAIKVRLKRKGLSRIDPEGYTARAVAEGFGVDVAVITRWISLGWLSAKRRGTSRGAQQGGDIWMIRPRAIRDFIIHNVGSIDIRKVEKHWFVEMLAGTPGGAK